MQIVIRCKNRQSVLFPRNFYFSSMQPHSAPPRHSTFRHVNVPHFHAIHPTRWWGKLSFFFRSNSSYPSRHSQQPDNPSYSSATHLSILLPSAPGSSTGDRWLWCQVAYVVGRPRVRPVYIYKKCRCMYIYNILGKQYKSCLKLASVLYIK